eukprot:CAMPEP_0113709372 /NCGR_PEP_ID=MMETSP0038_2-20120614/29530_1 /TAXON_ID=2898 /ORGANISM="Cryptomonas paramecium" /LENGTH=101 /DNA_ID=CAMNT_0000635241 /DNA_START=74 /DNA_END=379 /DNA_ORIENTATION=- /assembly_acc=CAM_ASM_000170
MVPASASPESSTVSPGLIERAAACSDGVPSLPTPRARNPSKESWKLLHVIICTACLDVSASKKLHFKLTSSQSWIPSYQTDGVAWVKRASNIQGCLLSLTV